MSSQRQHRKKQALGSSEMELIKVKRNYQLTIPSELRRKLKLAVGDYLEADVEDNKIVIRPVKVVHPDEAYFFTKEWQEREAQADRDIAEGDVLGPFNNPQDALKALKTDKV
jgi:AbrB family looped-hinge helix DNA binding protein